MTEATLGQFAQMVEEERASRFVARDRAYESDEDVALALRAIERRAPAVLISGRAGSGKSRLIHYIKGIEEGSRTLCVAPTGIAAFALGSPTIHSAFQLPIGVIDSENLGKARRVPQVMKKMNRLVIDEISMVRADLLDGIDARLRDWRQTDRPFGGVQVIMVGDFLQLPPVVRDSDQEALTGLGYETPFAFSARVLRDLPLSVVTLRKVWRQSDPSLIAALGDIRKGRNIEEAIGWLNDVCVREHRQSRPLILTATRASADAYNAQGLSKAIEESSAEPVTYQGKREGSYEDGGFLPAPDELTLVPGVRVMAVKNDVKGKYVNGSLGEVLDCSSSPDKVTVKFDTGETVEVEREEWARTRQVWSEGEERLVEEELGSYEQIPLTLGYAITVHKSQGLSLDDVRLDLGRGAFAPGQLYVALSRVRTLEGLSFARPLTSYDARVDPMMIKFLDWARNAPNLAYPD